MDTNNPETEKILYEYALAEKIENLTHPIGFINYKDVNLFCPQIYSDFLEESIKLNIDNTMAQDGVLYLDTNEKNGCRYYIDTHVGIIYAYDGNYRVLYGGNCSSQFDVFDAAYFRQYLSNSSFRNKMVVDMSCAMREILSLDFMGYKIQDIFAQPILEYTVDNKNELDEIIAEITKILSQSRFFRKLWFRGQRREYTTVRSVNTLKKLGFPCEYENVPSLVPSIGRHITKDNYLQFCDDTMYWGKAYKLWTLVQSNEYKRIFGIGTSGYKEITKSMEPDKLIKYIFECPYDIKDYLVHQYGDEKSEILTTQQYGGYSSMLDITDDIDVALFFTQSFLNPKTSKFELCAPSEENVIYIFAEARNTSTVNISDKVFHLDPVDGICNIPTRIKNQHCGLLIGANSFAKNTYGYRIVAKIHMKKSNIITTKKVCDMFPSKEVDSLFRTYSDIEPKLNGLYG